MRVGMQAPTDLAVPGENRRWISSAVFFLMLALLLTATPFRAGNRALPLLALELIGIALLIGTFSKPKWLDRVPLLLWMAVFLMVAWPLLQLVPLPHALWSTLPARPTLVEAYTLAGIAPGVARPLSVTPHAAWSSVLALIPPLAAFFAALSMTERHLRPAAAVFLSIAVAQAILGLMQYGTPLGHPLRLGNPVAYDVATGTYINRNHFAGLMEMALPLALALLVAKIGLKPHRSMAKGFGMRLMRYLSQHSTQAMMYGGIAVLIVLASIFSKSRAGITLVAVAFFLCAIVYSRRLGGRGVYGLVGTVFTLVIGFGIAIGLVPVIERFADRDALADGRWALYGSTLNAIGSYLPFGSGMGSFYHVFKPFQDPGDVSFVDHAHNDYLEWTLELGLVAPLLLTLCAVVYFWRWRTLLAEKNWSLVRFLQVAAGISVLLMGLHSVVDFNLRIPANAIFFAFLAGLFLNTSTSSESSSSERGRSRGRHRASRPEGIPKPEPEMEHLTRYGDNPFVGAQVRAAENMTGAASTGVGQETQRH
jgi:O-antigen ligase